MSTYHWVICDKHKEKCCLCADHAGHKPYSNSRKTLAPFIKKHGFGCKIFVVNEHDEILNDHDSKGLTTFDREYTWFQAD